jgi:hypothetical protein
MIHPRLCLRSACALALASIFAFVSVSAETPNALPDAEAQGRVLVQKILEQRPAGNYTNTGVLTIRANGARTAIPVQIETSVTDSNWQAAYSAQVGPNPKINGAPESAAGDCTALRITHSDNRPNRYAVAGANSPGRAGEPADLFRPFAGSDYWLCDLGLEFFHWPQQRVVKKEFHRQCACMVLESTNPDPATNRYSRVVAWIDEDSLGVVEAYAYDASGKKLKNFYPKSLEKVNGQYQLESMVMENLQTGSRSVFEFDLHK